MWEYIERAIKFIVFFDNRSRKFYQKGNGMGVKAFLSQRDDTFEFRYIVFEIISLKLAAAEAERSPP